MSIKALLTKILNRLVVGVIETGYTNGWSYIKYSNGYVDAWYYNQFTISHYATVNGFYAYLISGLSLPFEMSDANYWIDTTWQISSGFTIRGSERRTTTQIVSLYALATASGSQAVRINVHIYGKLA